MKERLIKRYANRKMYDVVNSRYVSLSDLAEIVKKGESIRVLNKNGDKDHTAQVLRQIILDQGKESADHSVSLLHEWIRLGGSFMDKQWEEMRSVMERWVKDRYSALLSGLKREDFITLKKKVSELEKQIEALNHSKKKK